jgi:hypothetical protein
MRFSECETTSQQHLSPILGGEVGESSSRVRGDWFNASSMFQVKPPHPRQDAAGEGASAFHFLTVLFLAARRTPSGPRTPNGVNLNSTRLAPHWGLREG